MGVSVVSVCNSALIKVGAEPIQSITQDTRSARLLNAIFEQVRDEVLRAHPWNFAIKRDSLMPNVSTPEFEYAYEYLIPSDCLRVLGLERDDIDFVVEQRKILTNEDTIKVRYIYRNEDPSDWDPIFAEALAWRLAQEVCYAITNSTERTDIAAKSYRLALAEARSFDGAEGIMKGLVADIFTNSRR